MHCVQGAQPHNTILNFNHYRMLQYWVFIKWFSYVFFLLSLHFLLKILFQLCLYRFILKFGCTHSYYSHESYACMRFLNLFLFHFCLIVSGLRCTKQCTLLVILFLLFLLSLSLRFFSNILFSYFECVNIVVVVTVYAK